MRRRTSARDLEEEVVKAIEFVVDNDVPGLRRVRDRVDRLLIRITGDEMANGLGNRRLSVRRRRRDQPCSERNQPTHSSLVSCLAIVRAEPTMGYSVFFDVRRDGN